MENYKGKGEDYQKKVLLLLMIFSAMDTERIKFFPVFFSWVKSILSGNYSNLQEFKFEK